jgi:hypothetical protein
MAVLSAIGWGAALADCPRREEATFQGCQTKCSKRPPHKRENCLANCKAVRDSALDACPPGEPHAAAAPQRPPASTGKRPDRHVQR